ncbi:hybrid sensor histidine kinase/response regulator [Heliophilum fasciatum]|uniref:Circadian input-output histidine kinase CikA n=1 Tax=Heliophilum fasciatum TaxID=35700 RepID=A0A4R2RPS8_9FIRM|nr:response regulator [Heliophilum fasciatum]MCW2277993.1 signal transduction histidine kinase [Heliophilum fasciatum]TCP64387.1 signal transduction histidine kinase [Heliophilum fasciatum]
MLDAIYRQKILIVDDSRTNIIALAELLKNLFEIKVANNGHTALRIALGDDPPDLILLDVMMPEMDGYEVCKRLKESSKTKDIPVIFITALDSPDDEENGLKLGAIDYITKPFNPVIVKSRVSNQLKIVRYIKEIEKSKNELRIAKEKAEEANILKSQFLSNINHEIRTPINGIVGFIEVLEVSAITEEQKEIIDYIKKSTKMLLDMISDILFLSKIESGNFETEEFPFSIHSAILDATISLDAMARKKGLDFSVAIDDKLPLMVIGDSMKLKDVLTRMVDNAIKFTEKGQVSVEAELMESNDDTIKILFRVKDTGIGMSGEILDHIFEPFTQGDASYKRKYNGAGVGLAICKSILDKMDSHICVESHEGIGSVFSFVKEFNKIKI